MLTSLPHAYSPEQLMQEAKFVDGLHLASSELLETFRLMPRRVRYVADSQRWLMSQAALALHFEHKSNSSKPAVTSQESRAPIRTVARGEQEYDHGLSDGNAALSFCGTRRTVRPASPRRPGDRGFRKARAALSRDSPARARRHRSGPAVRRIAAQGRFHFRRPTAICAASSGATRLDWPPPSVANFVKTDLGSNILHALLSRIPKHARVDGQPIWVGPVSPSEIAKHTLISPTHAVRLFARAREAGLVGWAHKSNRGDCWISSELAHDYRYWQALKLSAMSHAVRDAHQYLQTAILAPGAPDHQRHKSVGA